MDSRWLEAEPFSSICRETNLSLSTATSNRDEDVSAHRITYLECGSINCRENIWVLRHRAYQTHSNTSIQSCLTSSTSRSTSTPNISAGRSGKRKLDSLVTIVGESSPIRSTGKISRRNAQVVAKIRAKRGFDNTNQVISSPPLELMRFILRASEFSSMLKFAMESQDGRFQCLSRVGSKTIDLEPILDFIWKNYLPNTSYKKASKGLLSRAMKISLSMVQEIMSAWTDRWEFDLIAFRNTPKAKTYPDLAIQAIRSFVQICLDEGLPLCILPINAIASEERVVYKRRRRSSRNGLASALLSDGPRRPLTTREVKKTIPQSKLVREDTRQRSEDKINTKLPLIDSRLIEDALVSVGSNENNETPAYSVEQENSVDPFAPVIMTKKIVDMKRRENLLENEDNLFVSPGKYKTGNMPASLRRSKRKRKCSDDYVNGYKIPDQQKSILGNSISNEIANVMVRSSLLTELVLNKKNLPAGKTDKYFKKGDTTASLNEADPRRGSNFQKVEDVTRSTLIGIKTDLDSHWVELSHIGHISDYHGYERKHDSFLPLKFKASVSEARESINEVLKEANHKDSGESDNEVIAEKKGYEKAVSKYKKLQRLEREKRISKMKAYTLAEFKPKLDNFECQVIASHPIWFVGGPRKILPRANNNIESVISVTETSESIPCPGFEFIETDIDSILQDSFHDRKRRKSRSAELVAQKKISVLMLSEMRHTLGFIEEYNKGPLRNHRDPELVENCSNSNEPTQNKLQVAESPMIKVSENLSASQRKQPNRDLEPARNELQVAESPIVEVSEKLSTSRRKQPKWGMRADLCGSRKKSGSIGFTVSSESVDQDIPSKDVQNVPSRDVEDIEDNVMERLSSVTLDHSGVLDTYKTFRNRFHRDFPLPQDSSIDALKQCISMITKEKYKLIDIDEEIRLEEKAFIRITRGYRGKSDQERLEKTEHEEKRGLLLREYEYLNRSRKASPEEIELEKLESCPFLFVTQAISKRTSKKPCKFGKCCSLCVPSVDDSHTMPNNGKDHQFKSTIYNPRYSKVDLDDVDDKEENENSKDRRPNRIAASRLKKKASRDKLKEMYHTLEFIENYNTGRIK